MAAPQLNNQQMLDQMADEVREMLEAAQGVQGVQGDGFTRVVAALFHQLQLVWMVTVLQGLAGEDSSTEAQGLVDLVINMVACTMNALVMNLSKEDGAQVRNLAEQMHKRQVTLAARMNNRG